MAYKQPRRLNIVSGAMLLLALGGAYWMWKIFPVYLEAWSVDHILSDSASRVYKIQMMVEPDRTDALTKLVEITKLDVRKKAGIDDADLVINLNLQPTIATVTADYKVRVNHEWFSKVQIMPMHRESTADMKRVDWDK